MTGAATEMELDDFLGHSTRSGGGASFLDNWAKQRTPPEVRIVLHTKAKITAVWQHPWPKIVVRTDKSGKEIREVWSGNFNSWETEEILQRQYRRTDDGFRENPPLVCPMSIMLEEVERHMREGNIGWDTVLFKFAGDDPTKGKKLHAGAITNKMKKLWEELSEQEKRDARKKGIPGPSDAWKENMMAKCCYVFTVVDYDNLDDGIQIAKETTLIGDKMKKVIRDRMTSEGDDKGHPLKNPYVFQWKHDPLAKQFQDKYDVIAIGKLPITDAVRELIINKEPPDLARYTGRGDIEALRASMEDAYCGPADLLDWDFIFGKAEELAGIGGEETEESAEEVAADIMGTAEETEGAEAAEEPEEDQTPEAAVARGVAATTQVKPLVGKDRYLIAKRVGEGEDQQCFAKDGVELFACDACGAVIRDDEEKCTKCGVEVQGPEEEPEVEAEPEPEPEPEPAPAPRSRSTKATAPAKPATTASTRTAPAVTTKPTTAPAAKPSTKAPATSAAGTKAKAGGKDKLGF